MRFLLVIFLAGLGLATASNVLPHSFSDDVGLHGEVQYYEAVFDTNEDDAKALRNQLEELLEKLKEVRDNGQPISKELLLKMKGVFEEMESKDIKLTVVEQMVKWSVDYYLKLAKSSNSDVLLLRDDPTTELGKTLKKHFQEILEKVRDIIENGKGYKDDLAEKLKEIALKLKDMGVDIGEEAKSLLKKLKGKAKDLWKKILDKITPGSDSDVLSADEDDANALRKQLEELMEKLEQARITAEPQPKEVLLKMKDIFDEMVSKGIELTVMEQIVKSTVEYYLKIRKNSVVLEDSDVLLLRDDPTTELGKTLKKHFEEILEKVRDIIENGKAYSDDLAEKLKEIGLKLKDMGVDIGDEAKRLLKNLKKKAKDVWKKILDKITPGSDSDVLSADEGDELAKNLRERLEEILERIKDAIENNGRIGGNVVAKLREILKEMREKSIPAGDRIKELLQELKDKATGIWKRILDNINISKRGTGAENLRDRLQEMLEKLRDSIKDRKLPGAGFLSKLREIRDEMRQKNVPLGDKLKEFIEKLKENTTGVVRRILDRLGKNSPESSGTGAENLRDRLQELLERLRDAIKDRKLPEIGFLSKLREIRDEMRQKNVNLGDKLREFIDQLREQVTGVWKRVLDRLRQDASDSETGAENLRNRLQELLERIRDAIRDRKDPEIIIVAELKEVRDEMRRKNVDLGDKLRDLIDDLSEQVTGFWRWVLERLTESASDSETGAENLRDRLQELLERIRDAIRDRKLPEIGILSKLKEIRDEMRQKNVDLGEKLREFIDQLREQVTGVWQKVLDRLRQNASDSETGAENLRDRLQELLERIRDAIRDRKLPEIGILSKLREIRDEMRQKNVDLGEKLREFIDQLREKVTGVWQKVLDRFRQNASDSEDDLAGNLRERLNQVLNIIKDAFETRGTLGIQYLYHLEYVWNQLKEKNINPGERALRIIEELKQKTNGEWKETLYKLVP